MMNMSNLFTYTCKRHQNYLGNYRANKLNYIFFSYCSNLRFPFLSLFHILLRSIQHQASLRAHVEIYLRLTVDRIEREASLLSQWPHHTLISRPGELIPNSICPPEPTAIGLFFSWIFIFRVCQKYLWVCFFSEMLSLPSNCCVINIHITCIYCYLLWKA